MMTSFPPWKLFVESDALKRWAYPPTVRKGLVQSSYTSVGDVSGIVGNVLGTRLDLTNSHRRHYFVLRENLLCDRSVGAFESAQFVE